MQDHTDERIDFFFLSIDKAGSFLKLGNMIADVLDDDPKARANVADMRKWIASDKFLLRSTAVTAGDSGPLSSLFGAAPGVGELLTVGMLRAEEIMRRASSPSFFETVRGRLNRRDELMPNEHDFVAKLLVEARRRAETSSSFKERMRSSADVLEDMRPALEKLSKRVFGGATSADLSDPISRPVPEFCSINGNEAPCWLVIGIIVVIVIVGLLCAV